MTKRSRVEPEYYSTKQIAELEGVTRRTVQRWIQEGVLVGEKVGRTYRVSSNDYQPHPPVEDKTERDSVSAEREFLTTTTYAKAWGYTVEKVREMIKSGELIAEKIKGRYRIWRDQFDPERPNDPHKLTTDEDGIPVEDDSIYSPDELRKGEFATLQEAEDYRRDIPVSSKIIKNLRGKYRVIVTYEVGQVTVQNSEWAEDEDDIE